MNQKLNSLSRPCLSAQARLKYDHLRKTDLMLMPEKVIVLNSTGAAILQLCDGRRTVSEIACALEKDYGAGELLPDVLAFLKDVSSQGWVENRA